MSSKLALKQLSSLQTKDQPDRELAKTIRKQRRARKKQAAGKKAAAAAQRTNIEANLAYYTATTAAAPATRELMSKVRLCCGVQAAGTEPQPRHEPLPPLLLAHAGAGQAGAAARARQ